MNPIIEKSERLRSNLLDQAKEGKIEGLPEKLIDELFEHVGRLGEISARLKTY